MAYSALYRKWRPLRFEDVKGQDPIVRTLKNQILSGRIGHAYLFCGTRGTGKTTMAKIFARAVNCEHPVNGSPCNECAVCRSILAGSSVNVVEIDAASNNGVDNIREIREEVKYKPTEGNYRVYIIDEVHMLSAGAFNALLKTLEEPPEYVIFILATTEVHKIPVTVLSRCQRYDVRRLSLETLKDQLKEVLQAEHVDYEENAVAYIARAADGSSRDGLSILEQCVSYYYGETLTYERVLDVLGAVDQGVFSKLLRAVMERDMDAAAGTVDEIMAQGRDIGQFVTDLTWYLRNLLLIQTENPGEEVLGVSKDSLDRMREEAEGMEVNQVMRYIRILGELSNDLRYASSKRVLLEISLLKMMQPAMETGYEDLLDRVRVLEDRLSALSNGTVPAGLQNGGMASDRYAADGRRPQGGAERDAVRPAKTVEVPPAVYEDYRKVSEAWNELVEGEGRLFSSVFRQSTISAGSNGLEVVFRDPYYLKLAENREKTRTVAELLEAHYDKKFRVSLRLLPQGDPVPKIVPGKRIPGIEMDIEEE